MNYNNDNQNSQNQETQNFSQASSNVIMPNNIPNQTNYQGTQSQPINNGFVNGQEQLQNQNLDVNNNQTISNNPASQQNEYIGNQNQQINNNVQPQQPVNNYVQSNQVPNNMYTQPYNQNFNYQQPKKNNSLFIIIVVVLIAVIIGLVVFIFFGNKNNTTNLQNQSEVNNTNNATNNNNNNNNVQPTTTSATMYVGDYIVDLPVNYTVAKYVEYNTIIINKIDLVQAELALSINYNLNNYINDIDDVKNEILSYGYSITKTSKTYIGNVEWLIIYVTYDNEPYIYAVTNLPNNDSMALFMQSFGTKSYEELLLAFNAVLPSAKLISSSYSSTGGNYKTFSGKNIDKKLFE